MSLNKVLSEAEKARKEVAEICSHLIQYNSSHPEGKTNECVSFIKEYMNKHGIRNEVHSNNPLKPNIAASISGKSKRKILWVGHLDVVPEGKAEFWTHPPYSGKITSEGVIHGRGSSDMKGSCAAAMVAARILGGLEMLQNNVEFWFTSDEEIGGGEGAKWLAETKHFQGDVCVIGDGDGGGLEYPSIDIGCKGVLNTKLMARGRTAHGSTPYLGDNAITKLIKAIPFVEKVKDFKLTLPSELEAPIKTSTEFILKSQKLETWQKEEIKRIFHHPSVTCNVISGGVRRNVVPDYAEAEFDIRLTPGTEPVKVKERIEKLVKESGIPDLEVDVHATDTARGYYESPNTPFASQLAKTVQKITGKKPIFKILTGATDAISIKRYNSIPCLGYGMSVTGQAHQPNEYNTIDNLVLGVKTYAAFPITYTG